MSKTGPNPDPTYSKISYLWRNCMCRGCFPVDFFPIPDEFWDMRDNHDIYNMVGAVLGDRHIDMKDDIDAEF